MKSRIIQKTSPYNNPKSIAVMLDLDGTTDFINDNKASKFANQLEILRKKFDAQLCTISISTHNSDYIQMQDTLDMLAHNLPKNIKIGINFYYGGIYDYDKKENINMGYNFNYNKVSTFYDYYINPEVVNNKWFAIIDDGISQDTYKPYKNTHPMFLCRPSQKTNCIKSNCLMSISTITRGFDGVIESLDAYIKSIKDLSPNEILKAQRNMITHLSSYELMEKFFDKDYLFIERYFSLGYADYADYETIFKYIIYISSIQNFKWDELIELQSTLKILSEFFESNNNKQNVEKIKCLQKNIPKRF